jgi:hypothetical protein
MLTPGAAASGALDGVGISFVESRFRTGEGGTCYVVTGTGRTVTMRLLLARWLLMRVALVMTGGVTIN